MPLEQEFAYYKEYQEELVRQYEGKYLVIVGQTVISAHESELDAYESAKATHPLVTFLIQHCLHGQDSYTQTFHSRVMFH